MTPLEEFQAESVRRVQAMAKEPGERGAYARLVLRISPHEVAEWIVAEKAAGTSSEDTIRAAGNYVGMILITAGSSFEQPVTTINMLNLLAASFVQSAVDGQMQATGIAVDSDGKQQIVTIEGVLQGKSTL